MGNVDLLAKEHLNTIQRNKRLEFFKIVCVALSLLLITAYAVMTHVVLNDTHFSENGVNNSMKKFVRYVIPILTVIFSAIPMMYILKDGGLNVSSKSAYARKIMFMLAIVASIGASLFIPLVHVLTSTQDATEKRKKLMLLMLYSHSFLLLINLYAMRIIIPLLFVHTMLSGKQLMIILLMMGMFSMGSNILLNNITSIFKDDDDMQTLLDQYKNMSEAEQAEFRNEMRSSEVQ